MGLHAGDDHLPTVEGGDALGSAGLAHERKVRLLEDDGLLGQGAEARVGVADAARILFGENDREVEPCRRLEEEPGPGDDRRVVGDRRCEPFLHVDDQEQRTFPLHQHGGASEVGQGIVRISARLFMACQDRHMTIDFVASMPKCGRKSPTLTDEPSLDPENNHVMSFAELGLREEILRAIQEVGYETPTEIQARAIPNVLNKRDVVGIAQTGTGKTASFTLPMLHRLASGRARARMPRSLILSPTRELATQTSENFETYGRYLGLTKALLIGGVAMGGQEKLLEKGVDVLIATPGRLLDWFDRGRILLGGVQILVIDEADRMLDMGFIPDVERIISLLPKREQTLLFSATMLPEVRRLASRFLTDPVEITVARKTDAAELIDDVLVPVGGQDKRQVLDQLIASQNVDKAILFSNRKRDVGTLTRFLRKRGRNAQDIHGDLDQAQRQATLEAFKSGEVDFLVATDVAARGLDISDMPVVVNVDVPMNAEDYIHRIGRTGRAGRRGRAFTLATDLDRKYVANIEKLVGRTIERLEIDVEAAETVGKGGRKAKAPAKAAKAATAKPAETESPAEAPAAAEAPTTAEAPETTKAKPARKAPARRRGKAAETTAKGKSGAGTTAAEEAADEASATETAATATAAEAVEDKAAAGEAPPTDPAPAKPGRRRRTPRKKDEAATEAPAAAEMAPAEAAPTETAEAAEAAPAKPRRRRGPRKGKAEAPAEAASIEERTDEPAAAPVEEAPAEELGQAAPDEDAPEPEEGRRPRRKRSSRGGRKGEAAKAKAPASDEQPTEKPTAKQESRSKEESGGKAGRDDKRKGEKDRDRGRKGEDRPVVGMGDHVPAFLRRPVPVS